MSSDLLQKLARRIREIEAKPCLAHGVVCLQDVFPGESLPRGTLVDVLSVSEGGGAWTLALLMAREVCAARKILVVADSHRRFYPPAASKLGIDLARTLVIRPRQQAHALTALVQSLRCQAVGAVIGNFERLTSAAYRSLQLAVEAGGGVGFLVLPTSALKMPSFAGLRLRVGEKEGRETSGERREEMSLTPHPSPLTTRHIHVEVVRMRGGKANQSFLLEVDHETGHVRVPAPLADATSPPYSPRASG